MKHSFDSRQRLKVAVRFSGGSLRPVLVLTLALTFVVSASAQAPRGPRVLLQGR